MIDLETLTWAEYFRLGEGFHRRHEAERDAAWERTRWQTWQLINIQLEKKDRLPHPKDLLYLPTDAPLAPVVVALPETKEEKLARARRLDPDKFH